MFALDEHLEAATRELHEALDNARLAPASAVIRRHARRRHSVTALATAIAVLGVVGLGIVVTRDVEPADHGSPTDDPIVRRLLFPTGISEGDIRQVYLGPDLPNHAKGLVRAPGGALFRISIVPSGGSGPTPDVDRRDFNSRTFTLETTLAEYAAYASLDECVLVSVEQSDPSGKAWDTNASTVLAALTIEGRAANLALPPGWESFGVGNGGRLIQLAYTATIGTTRHDVVLMQLPEAPIAAISGIAQGTGPLTSTTFGNHQAWTVSSAEPATTSLIWQDGTNAVLLAGEVTLDELEQIAANLQHDQGDEWARHLPTAESLSGSGDTSPLQPSTNTETCGTPRLTINQAGESPSPSTQTASP